MCIMDGPMFAAWQDDGTLGWAVDLLARMSRMLVGRAALDLWMSCRKQVKTDEPPALCWPSLSMGVVASPNRNMVFACSDGVLNKLLGSGKIGFSIASDPLCSQFNGPLGVSFDKESKVLLVSDSGNSTVRCFLPGEQLRETTPWGSPQRVGTKDGSRTECGFLRPGRMSCLDGRVVLVDGPAVRELDLKAGKARTLHRSSGRITAVAAAKDGVAYCVEET